MTSHRWRFTGFVVAAVFGQWLLLAGPDRVLGIDAGNAGVRTIMAVAWGALLSLAYTPAGEMADAISPGEWRAWIGLGFTAIILLTSIVHAPVFQGPALWNNPDAQKVGRNIALLVIGWMVLSHLLRMRWLGKIEQDERDRRIEAGAAGWARGSLVVYCIGMALLLGFSPVDRMQSAAPAPLAQLLVIGLIASSLVENPAIALTYLRDRS